MQFIDLKTQQEKIKAGIDARIQTVLAHGKYIMGPEIKEFEQVLVDFVKVKHCIACSSGTDALLMALMAWDIGPGDAVFTSPFTFIATAEVVQLLGATPVFVDIDENTFNINPVKLDEEINRIKKEGKLTPKVIMPVDLFGLPANYPEIDSISRKYDLLVLEDGAQGFGGSIEGKMACSFGTMAATSFFPAKPLGCYGDGGAIFTNEDSLAEKLASIRVHGKGGHKYDNVRVGINGRFDTLQAAILLEKMTIFPEEIRLRNVVAAQYTERLKNKVITPFIPDGYVSAWAQYSIVAESADHRTEIQERLKNHDIPTAIYYPIPLHLQTAFTELGYQKGDFPVSELTSERILSLPMHPYLTESDIEKITSLV